jgi:hypothetical protein
MRGLTLQRSLTCASPSPPDPLSPKRGEGEKKSVVASQTKRGDGKREVLLYSYVDSLFLLDEGDDFAQVADDRF